jgi:hypothetical protein
LTDQEAIVTKSKSRSKAKAKSDSNKSDSKKTESGIPKKVAGVKVPKAVRESGSLSALFNSSLGREILADALIAAAGAAAAALTRSRTAKNAGKAVADAGSAAAAAGTDLTHTAAGAVATVVTEAAKNFLPASLVGGEEQGKAEGGDEGRPRYVNLASDHSARQVSKKAEKTNKAGKS